MNRNPERGGTTPHAGGELSIDTYRVLIAGAAGILTFCILAFIEPQGGASPPIDPKASVLFNLSARVSRVLNSPYVVVPMFLVWTYLAISRRDRPKSWILAFLAGVAIACIILRWILHWV
jgi:hypothetical protein